MKRLFTMLLLLCLILPAAMALPSKEKSDGKEADKGPLNADTFKGLALRSIGPAMNSGRVVDIAMHPTDRHRYFVASASGGVWKTENNGTTWTPVFDDQGSYSIGCVAIDPNNPLIVWVGTGENNSQRSVSYGDGVYKSVNGGKKWKKVGLDHSEHIGEIIIHPEDSDTVYTAAQGPLWAPGGDRGLYKTTDGGQTWEAVLSISENTGVSDIAMDPRDPDVLYATAYQRRRHVWTLINGGPESALYKTRDGGKNWEKLDLIKQEDGEPVELGRIGIALSPANPDVVYAIVEATGKAGGFFRSLDGGVTWEKRNDYVSLSPQYYQEIIADPKKVDRVYSMDTWMRVTEDGGKTIEKMAEKMGGLTKHVDDHALWIDPENTDHLLNGNDGGVYETFDRGRTWQFKANLPITQFYRASADNDTPFYNVYGGTQDNNTLGGPSRTTSVHGITNADWFRTASGDGYKTRVDPENPDIVYSQSQYGGLVRYDRKNGQRISIKPQPGPDETPLRWNWDSPLILSPHSNTRLYFAAQKIFRSDDRGDSWRAVSPDLTRQIDRNQLEVMGKVWSIDAVDKNASTSFYGNLVSLSESPLVEGLIYAGADDGLIQVTEDGGGSWRKIEKIPGIPVWSYVSRIEASLHDEDTVYAAFDNHKMGDFKPYLLKSTDRGRTWVSIAGGLPDRGSVYAMMEDHVKADLLFAGTEFGLFFTPDGGKRWVQLKGGMPVIAVRDLDIQRRENDLIVGTFGRGIYILDDYTSLRMVSEESLDQDTLLFPVKQAWMFIERTPFGSREKGSLGDAFFTAPNPPFGAVFTYYLKEDVKTRRQTRLDLERKTEEEKGVVTYPSWETLRAEEREEKPAVVFTVKDAAGDVIRRLTGPAKAGVHRVAWDLRYPAPNPTALEKKEDIRPWVRPPRGPMVVPGNFTVSMAVSKDGKRLDTDQIQSFITVPLGAATLPAADREALVAFQKKTAGLQRAVLGAVKAAEETAARLAHIKQALEDTPAADPALMDEARKLENRLKDLQIKLSGDKLVRGYDEPTLPSITERVQRIVSGHWASTSAPTQTQIDNYGIAGDLFEALLSELRALIEADLTALEDKLEAAGGPWTPGRVPRWER